MTCCWAIACSCPPRPRERTSTSSAASCSARRERLGARTSRIHAGRPQTNGNVEALYTAILDDAGTRVRALRLPALHRLRRKLDTYLAYYNTDHVHHGRLTRGRIPADIVYGARRMERR